MDLLDDRLVRARASGAVFARSVARPPWGLTLPGSIQLSLHTVLRGHLWLWLGDRAEAVRLLPGDLALVVGGRDHHIAHEPDLDLCMSHEQFWARDADDAADPDAAIFLCGAYRLAGDVGRGLIQALPPMLVIRPAPHDQVHDVVSLISRELSDPTPGQQTVLDRLLDVLLVMGMRASFAQSATAPRWYHAASDPRLGRALQAIHDEPARAWTVPELAHLSAMSRPSFARNFERALGQSPMQYLTDWRLTLAREPTGRRAHFGTDRRSHRLQVTQRVRGDIPPTRWIGTRSMAPALLVTAATGGAGIASAVALALMGRGGVPTRSTAGGARWRARSR